MILLLQSLATLLSLGFVLGLILDIRKGRGRWQ